MDQRFFFAAEKSSQKFLDLSNILCREGGGGCMNQKPIFENRNFLECCGYPAYLKIGYPGDIGYQAILFSDEKYFF